MTSLASTTTLIAASLLLVSGCDARNLIGYNDNDGGGMTPGSDDAGLPSNPDLPPPPSDANPLRDAVPGHGDAIAQVGPTYSCGPAGAGLKCSCGLQPFFPAPVDENGQQQTYVLPPDPATVVHYANDAEFDAVATGRWRRTAGEGELVCEQYGLELTADHHIVPLVIASDGSIQGVTALQESFTVIYTGRLSLAVNGTMPSNEAPIFFDGGQSMYWNLAPWPADYVRVP